MPWGCIILCSPNKTLRCNQVVKKKKNQCCRFLKSKLTKGLNNLDMNRIPKNRKLSKIEKNNIKSALVPRVVSRVVIFSLPGKGEGDTMTDT